MTSGSNCRLVRRQPERMTARRERQDIRASADSPESTAPMDSTEPTESTEAAEPTAPIESTDPTEPTESTEPLDAMQRRESSEQIDQRAAITLIIVAEAAVRRPDQCPMTSSIGQYQGRGSPRGEVVAARCCSSRGAGFAALWSQSSG